MAAAAGASGDKRARWTMVWLIVFFTVLTVLFNYPISTAPDTYLSHLTDPRLVTWTMAWNAHAYATNPLAVFHPNIYFPDPATKASSETFLLPSLLVAPFNWAGHPVLAYNLVLLSGFVLSGLGAALWVRHMTGSLAAGIVAGMIWAFAPGKFDQVAHLHMMLGQWIPFALLYCGRYLEGGRARDLYAMSLFAAAQFGFSMHYGVFLMPLLGLYGLALLVVLPSSAVRANLARMRRQLTIAAAGFAALVVAVGLPYWWTHDQVGLRRNYREILALSGQPDSFVSGSMHNQAAHVAWLFERYHIDDASYFIGLVPLLLAGFGLLVLWPRALRQAGGAAAADVAAAADGDAQDGTAPADGAGLAALEEPALEDAAPGERASGVDWRKMRRRAHAVAMVLGAAAFALHLAGLSVAWSGAAGWASAVVSLSVTVHPALWAAVAGTVALLTLPAGDAAVPRRNAYLIVVGYLTLITYLLAYGPEIQAFGALLGHGPYWLLYRFLLPFQIIRSAGRIGLLWILCAAALAGFTLAYVERRWTAAPRPAGSTPRPLPALALALLVVVLVGEFRVWPMRHYAVDPAADPADVWLAQQPGDFAIVHAPIETGRDAAQETAYMLGSTLHWKNMVNGYLRFAPPPYRELAKTPQLGAQFFRRLRADFPVRYLLVHEDRLTDEQQWAQVRRLLAANSDAAFVTQLGYTLVFEVPGGDGGSAAEGAFGFEFERAYSVDELAAADGVQISLRGAQTAATDTVVALAGWGERKSVIEIADTWREVRLAVPDGLAVAPPAEVARFELRAHTLRPAGRSGALVMAGFTIEAARRGTVVGVGGRVFDEARQPGLRVYRLEEYGNGLIEVRRFPPTPEGAEQMRRYVRGLPEGALTGMSLKLDEFVPFDAALADALRLIGATPGSEELLLAAVLGVRGADAGTALQMLHHNRAFIDIQGPTPVLQVRDISLY